MKIRQLHLDHRNVLNLNIEKKVLCPDFDKRNTFWVTLESVTLYLQT